MTIDSYFEILAADDIRIKGTRVGIETVLYEYIHRGQSAEQIAERFDALTLEQIYATILYYLHNRETISAYLADWLEYGEQARAAQSKDPTFQRLRERLQQMRAAREGEVSVGIPTR